MIATVPEPVRRKAIQAGAGWWLDLLPGLIADLTDEWQLSEVGTPFANATEAWAASATCADGTPAVLKLLVPRGDLAANEIVALQLAEGRGCVRALRSDVPRSAVLLEHLGSSMFDLRLPIEQRDDALVAALEKLWHPVGDVPLPTSADKARSLQTMILRLWDETGRELAAHVVEHALAAARRRLAAYDPTNAVLLHGDPHQWNALQSPHGYVLVDPDGLVGEREYDLGVLVREDPLDAPGAEPRSRTDRLARRTGTDPQGIWDWGLVERVSTGLLLQSLDMTTIARQILGAAQQLADQDRDD